MDEPRLIINSEKEFELDGDFISIGRASNNSVAFPEDSNVSRYHAEIEKRGDEFWIIDLNSSNGTKVNGEKVATEKPLSDGDLIVFGGTSEVQILLSPREEEKKEEDEEETNEEGNLEKPEEKVEETAPTPNKPKVSLLFIFAGLFVGLAFLAVMTAGIIYFTRSGGTTTSDCPAQAKITNPRNGEFVKKETNIEIELNNGGCVKRVIFLIDGEPFATSEEAPFSIAFNPADFPDFAADGLDHKISLILEDENGNKIPQTTEVALAIETIKTKKPKEDETPIDIEQTNTPTTGDDDEESTNSANMSIIELQKLTKTILPQFAGKFEYQTNNQAFLQAVNQMTKEYASAGYFERAKKYNETIAKEFIQNRDLDPPLGYFLAMSRTKFQMSNDSEGAGLWKMNNDLVLNSGYNGACGTETIAEPSQKCAAIASSTYVKDIIRDVFDGDIIYGIAAFGMSKNEAEAWRDSLPPAEQRKDFWNVIKSNEQKELVVRFFAAATVAENPQKFGLENDKPLSQFYKVYMK